jgi:hypothetical protein
MGNRTLVALAAAAAAILAPPATASAYHDSWSVTVGIWGGVSRYDVLGLKHGIGTVGTEERQDLIDGNFDTVGAQTILRIGWLDLGLLYEGTLVDTSADSEILTPLVGFKWDVARWLRLDLLAELGGHKITNIGSGNELATETRTVWLPSLGIRPSISYRLPVGPLHLLLSVTPFARWDLVKKDVDVESGPGSWTSYEAGGSTFGLVGGGGIEF